MNAKRDWGHAKDYVEAMYLILQQDKPEDFVIATGVTTTIKDFVKMAFAEVGMVMEFQGEGVNEVGIITECNNPDFQVKTGEPVVLVDERYFRPTEVELLIGDPTKSQTKLGWKPKYDLPMLVKDMVSADLELFKRDQYLKKGGHKIMNYHE